MTRLSELPVALMEMIWTLILPLGVAIKIFTVLTVNGHKSGLGYCVDTALDSFAHTKSRQQKTTIYFHFPNGIGG